jgi:hypothetical protein
MAQRMVLRFRKARQGGHGTEFSVQSRPASAAVGELFMPFPRQVSRPSPGRFQAGKAVTKTLLKKYGALCGRGRTLLSPDQSARGLAQSKTLARMIMALVCAKRLGLRWFAPPLEGA